LPLEDIISTRRRMRMRKVLLLYILITSDDGLEEYELLEKIASRALWSSCTFCSQYSKRERRQGAARGGSRYVVISGVFHVVDVVNVSIIHLVHMAAFATESESDEP
jgi:hypothetical protein